jgi:hypothetical protein
VSGNVLTDIRVAIAGLLRNIDNLRASEYETDALNPPAYGAHAVVTRGPIPYHLALGSSQKTPYVFLVQVYCNRINEQHAQDFLDLLCLPSNGGIKYALEGDGTTPQTLGGLCDYVWVKSVSGPTLVSRPPQVEVWYLMVEFELEVMI